MYSYKILENPAYYSQSFHSNTSQNVTYSNYSALDIQLALHKAQLGRDPDILVLPAAAQQTRPLFKCEKS